MPTSAEAVLAAVRAAWRAVLPWHDANDQENWAEAGGDSLDAMKLLAHLEIALGVSLLHDLITPEATPPAIARRITALLPQGWQMPRR